jgi:hypothetical protein
LPCELSPLVAWGLANGIGFVAKPCAKKYTADDFKYIRPSTVPARWGLELLRGRASQLAQLWSRFFGPNELAPICWNALCTLAVAFAPHVGHAQAVGAIADALEGAGRSVDTLDAEVRRELAKGSVWSDGGAYREPTKDERRFILSILEPDALSRAVGAFLADKTETRFDDVAEHLRGLGLIASGKVNVAENREVSGALVAAGWSHARLAIAMRATGLGSRRRGFSRPRPATIPCLRRRPKGT